MLFRSLSLLMLLGLVSISFITNKNIVAGIAMACIGILLGAVGTDTNSGITRYVGDYAELADGINIPVISIGIFGIAEIFNNLLSPRKTEKPENVKIKFGLTEFKRMLPSSLRGTAVGSFFGLIPGGGAVMSSFAAYAV